LIYCCQSKITQPSLRLALIHLRINDITHRTSDADSAADGVDREMPARIITDGHSATTKTTSSALLLFCGDVGASMSLGV